jgi:Spy/CpxP family protein refolding chaperone
MKKRIGLLVAIFAAAFLLGVALVSAQQPEPPPGPKPQQGPPPHPPMDPFGDALFPPDLVMQHQRELGLTDEQKTFMRGEINRTMTRFNELQWQLQDATEVLHETMKANSVNEQLALSQLDKILDGEREIKRAHMELAIRIKNKLTPEQQTKLQSLRKNMEPGPGGPGGPGPGRGPGGRGPGGPGRGPGGPGGPGPGGPGQRPPDGVPEQQY